MKNVNLYSKKCSRTPISRFLLLGCVSVLAAYGYSTSVQAANPNYALNKSNGAVPYANYYIYGTLAGLPEGSWIDIKNNADKPQILKTNGKFKISKGVAADHAYHVTVVKDPYIDGKGPLPYKCTVLHGQGVMPAAHVEDVQVTCAPDVVEPIEPNDPVSFDVTDNFDGFRGAYPTGNLIHDKDSGNFYGTAQGGKYGYGMVFKITPLGKIEPLSDFGGTVNLQYPHTELVLGSDGYLYGTTRKGGQYGSGTIFALKPDGSGLTIVHSFEGYNPSVSALVEANEGVFYGTSYANGGSYGSVFKIIVDRNTKKGTLSTLHSFKISDGRNPEAKLVRDGNLFYGTTTSGGLHNQGTIYSITLDGILTPLYSFKDNEFDPSSPKASLTKGKDGKFYGTSFYGGKKRKGTIYRFTPQESTEKMVKTLVHFGYDDVEGVNPNSGLTLSRDGSLYGTTVFGSKAASNLPSLFRFTPSAGDMGKLTTLHLFNPGDKPYAGLVENSNEDFLYGTTQEGGLNGVGTIYKLTR